MTSSYPAMSISMRHSAEPQRKILSKTKEGPIKAETINIASVLAVIRQKSTVKNKGRTYQGGNNQYCIGIGCDQTKVYCKIEGLGTQPTYKTTYDTFIDHIQKGSTLIHDKERCHNILIEPLELTSFSYNSVECKKLKGDENPLKPINDQCALLKQFLKAHRGFDRNHLQDYLNLYVFISNPPYNRLEKVEYLINCVVSNVKTIRYRDVMSHKTDK